MGQSDFRGWQIPEKMRVWETCCFCLTKHKDGIHWKRDPRSKELKCGGLNPELPVLSARPAFMKALEAHTVTPLTSSHQTPRSSQCFPAFREHYAPIPKQADI
jgi:hypothetical protein